VSKKRQHKEYYHEAIPVEPTPAEAIPITAGGGISAEARGASLLAFAFISTLSTLSFAYAPDTANWLGSLGHTIGKIWFALLGLGTYPVCGLVAWVGWRKLFRKPINHLKARIGYVALCVIAINLILCIAEEALPSFNDWLGETLLQQMWHQKLRYHLGGAPFFFIYKDLPRYNLVQLFNALGVAFIALMTLGCGLLYLCKSSPTALLEQLSQWYQNGIHAFNAWWYAPEAKTAVDTASTSIPQQTSTPSVPSTTRKATPTTSQPSSLSTSRERSLLPTRRRTQRMLTALTTPSDALSKETGEDEEEHNTDTATEIQPHIIPTETALMPLAVNEAIERRCMALDKQRVHNGDFSTYILPPGELLTPGQPIDTDQLSEELRQQADILEETLLNFGIEAKVGNINCGPTITSFEVHPAVGVKVQRIKALGNDIALNLEAKSIRIIAPIPGKAAVGIEVPNPEPQEVSFYELLEAYQAGSKRFHIPMLLGKAVNGDMVMNDLAKMPHLIIAGATGSGKSVCINTIVMSIVLNAKPDEVKLLMIDPKKVELTPYSRLPHMLAPVITEPQGACAALQWLVKEMEKRYELLKLLGLRNIEAFNNRTPDLEREASLSIEVPQRLHYIVGIIDELADLMMVSSNDIETFIARIAQMARAIGIHLILATQRPSREVITGLIKANFPARISFKVASRVNSQIILDEIGAESLLGNGDMLFLPPGTSQLMRAQGAYIRDEDINRVVQFTCEQAPPNYVIQSFDNMQYQDNDDNDDDDEYTVPSDALFTRAKEVVISTGNASTTFLQRKLKIGYARAASLMDQLEKLGIVSPLEGSKARKVLAGRDSIVDDDDDYGDEDEAIEEDEEELL
jgi:S-DNA-T family DNA segregation ATPase FtsK/SpoIIIE